MALHLPEDPPGCLYCGAIAGCCDFYPLCPGSPDWKPMDKNLAAYTSPAHPYPEYVSINERDGAIEIAVRSPPSGPNMETCGTTAAAHMTRERFSAFLKECRERFESAPPNSDPGMKITQQENSK
jgi:hypothetical protein